MNLLSNTPKKYLGLFNPDNPEESKAAALKNHMMLRTKYNALVSGDGACAGCGEKSVLHAIATLTETMMRPIYHHKADRFNEKADKLPEPLHGNVRAYKHPQNDCRAVLDLPQRPL